MGSIQDGLAVLTRRLAADGNENPAREARLLLSHQLGTEASRLTLIARESLADEDLQAALRLCSLRADGVPISHIRGYREFWGRRFEVDSRVLDPRPETEELVAEALSAPFSRILDLGTGSGCILVTLLAERPSATGLGADLSSAALEVARANADRHGVADRCTLAASDWFERVEGRFDLIVSNPPYISAAEMLDLQPGVIRHEPRMALTDEGDGLAAYRAIAARARAFLAPGGRLLVEIGPGQGAAVMSLFRAAGLDDVSLRGDMDGRDRVVSGRISVTGK